MKTRIKLGDILAVQCVNIITIACKVLKWIMAYFSTVFFLTTSMLIVGSDKNVEEMSIAMNMLISGNYIMRSISNWIIVVHLNKICCFNRRF